MNDIKIILIGVLLFILIGCKDNEVNDLYNQRVNLKVDITTLDGELRSPDTSKTVENARSVGEYTGYGGLLLYRAQTTVDGYPNIFGLYAFDLACPIEKIASQKVEYIGDGKAKCSKCETVYDVSMGLGTAVDKPNNPRLVVYRAYYVPGDHIVFHVIKK